MPKNAQIVKGLDFFILHEEIVKKADHILAESGGLDRKTDQQFYGFGAGEESNRSINFVLYGLLRRDNFSFRGFFRDQKDSSVKFNVDYLRMLKTVYNRKFKENNFDRSTVSIKQNYLAAFLFFLGYDEFGVFIQKSQKKYKKATKIAHTVTAKSPKEQLKFFFENRNITEDYKDAIKNKLEHTEWYLYTYNYDNKKIVKASIEFMDLGEGNNLVRLVNSGGGYDFLGHVNFRLASHRIISLDLASTIIPVKHFHFKFYINFGRNQDVIMLGKQIGFGHSFRIITSNAILRRIDQEETTALGIGFYDQDHPDLPPAVKRFLHPANVQYSVIPGRTFYGWEDLDDWLRKPSEDQPDHFDIDPFDEKEE